MKKLIITLIIIFALIVGIIVGLGLRCQQEKKWTDYPPDFYIFREQMHQQLSSYA